MISPRTAGAPPSADGEENGALAGILLKIASVCILVSMASLIKATKDIPVGEIVFFRSFFALFPIAAYLAARKQLDTAFRTDNIVGHGVRGLVGVTAMALNFYGLTHLPLPEAISIGYAMPLLAVVFGALILHETVRLYRWSAVLIGMAGVLTITIPQLTVFSGNDIAYPDASSGALAVLASACFAALAVIQVRRLISSERTPTIVIYFSTTASLLALATLPFGWVVPDFGQATLLVLAGFAGGIGQILLTQSYRHADTSTIAPFEYTSLLLSLVIGYFIFGDVPTAPTLIGASIVIAAGIFIIYREHKLGIERARTKKVLTPQG